MKAIMVLFVWTHLISILSVVIGTTPRNLIRIRQHNNHEDEDGKHPHLWLRPTTMTNDERKIAESSPFFEDQM
jgi:hypothetical protein